jgi:hypothetical protein
MAEAKLSIDTGDAEETLRSLTVASEALGASLRRIIEALESLADRPHGKITIHVVGEVAQITIDEVTK